MYKYINIGILLSLIIVGPVCAIQVMNQNYSIKKAVKIIAIFSFMFLGTSLLREYPSNQLIQIIISASTLVLALFLNPFRKKKFKIIYSYNDEHNAVRVREFFYEAEEKPNILESNEVIHLQFEISRSLPFTIDPLLIKVIRIGNKPKSLKLNKS